MLPTQNINALKCHITVGCIAHKRIDHHDKWSAPHEAESKSAGVRLHKRLGKYKRGVSFQKRHHRLNICGAFNCHRHTQTGFWKKANF
ncbi:hypothetical protein Amal_00394 [Acetobacter malorum]|uniref:Uncharacterized protein n=1 Tax=Acetobacter malorum TaxID=178901 RepID=A0A177GF09_9PROT|nr:hypothetical protein Amal_00394 [Acetobacter malorum]